MADKKISDLTSGAPAQSTDLVPIDRSGVNFKLALSDLSSVVGGTTPLTTKGDLFGHSTVDARVPIGTDGQVLTADSTQALGVKWAAAADGDILSTVASSTAALTVNENTADVWDITLTANCTFTLTSVSSGVPISLFLMLRQDATGSRTVTWPGSVTWVGGRAPVLQTAASAVDFVTLYTDNGGTTWFAWYESGGGPGSEIGYAQITSTVNVVSTTEATGTTIISPGGLTFDGGPVLVHVFCWIRMDSAGVGDSVVVSLFEGATQLTRLIYAETLETASTQFFGGFSGYYRFTPSAGSHTYTVTAFATSTTGTPGIVAGSGGAAGAPPAFIRFTKV